MRPTTPTTTGRRAGRATLAAAVALAVLAALLGLGATPAGAGSRTETNACAWPDEARRAVDITLSGDASTQDVVVGEQVDLTGARVSGTLPEWVAGEAYDWGIIHAGENALPITVKVVLVGAGTVEGTQTVTGSTTLEFDYDPSGPQPTLGVDIDLPDTTWEAAGTFLSFTQGRIDISGTVGEDSLTFFRDCRPARFNQSFDHSWVTPLPFETAGTITFSDVPQDHLFAADIYWMVDEGITTGYPDGTFQPTNVVTRQTAAAFLWRYAGEPAPPEGAPTFPDVPDSNPFKAAISWMASEGITTGYQDGSFRPTEPVTRGSLAAFLWRSAGQPTPPEGSPTFSDVPGSSPFATAISWMAGHEITTGYEGGTFRPGNPVTRQSAAAFLHRFDQLPPA